MQQNDLRNVSEKLEKKLKEKVPGITVPDSGSHPSAEYVMIPSESKKKKRHGASCTQRTSSVVFHSTAEVFSHGTSAAGVHGRCSR